MKLTQSRDTMESRHDLVSTRQNRHADPYDVIQEVEEWSGIPVNRDTMKTKQMSSDNVWDCSQQNEHRNGNLQ